MKPPDVAPIVQSASRRFTEEATLVYWIHSNPTTVGTLATISIYDGFDANGIERYRCLSGYTHLDTFEPPIRCQDALYVYVDAEISTYEIGYRTEASLKLDKE